MDYKGLAALLQQYSPVQQVGDVIPFRRQSIEPGMGLTEGARAYPGGAYSFQGNDIRVPPRGTPEWDAYQSAITDALLKQINNAASKEGVDLGDTYTKYGLALQKQKSSKK